jgi:hypothetical protein
MLPGTIVAGLVVGLGMTIAYVTVRSCCCVGAAYVHDEVHETLVDEMADLANFWDATPTASVAETA